MPASAAGLLEHRKGFRTEPPVATASTVMVRCLRDTVLWLSPNWPAGCYELRTERILLAGYSHSVDVLPKR
jgi:hypothetical protein